MSTQRLTQLRHPNHKHLSQLTIVGLVLVSSLLIGLVPLIGGFSLIVTQEDNLILPTEAELWKPVGEAIE